MKQALHRMWTTLATAAIVAATALALLLITAASTKTQAHWRYSAACCSDVDCAPVPDSAVHETGSTITLHIAPGQHPMWGKDRPAAFVGELHRSALQPPLDGRWHVCLSPAGTLLCVYPPARSF
jgi:hypothetical protein